jgi:hypothetical protein
MMSCVASRAPVLVGKVSEDVWLDDTELAANGDTHDRMP